MNFFGKTLEILKRTWNNAITDIGTLLTYLIDLIFLFKEEKNYMKYLTQRLYYSEIHAKEFVVYEKNIIEDLYSK